MSTHEQSMKSVLFSKTERYSGWQILGMNLPQLRYLAYKAGTKALNLLPKIDYKEAS